MKLSCLLSPVIVINAASATSILLPLYVYPNCLGSWNSVYDAIASHPTVNFQIILNPASGPGGQTPGYNSDWITAVSKLRSYRNVETFGYVYVNYGQRPVDDVATDVINWYYWNSHTEADISVDGIFFDETPNWKDTRGDDDVLYMTDLSTIAGYGGFRKIFNLGQAPVHQEYFDIADTVVIFENTAGAYKNGVLDDVVEDGSLAGRSSVLIHHFEGSRLTPYYAQRWIRYMVYNGIGSFAIVNTDWTNANSGAQPIGIGILADMLELARA